MVKALFDTNILIDFLNAVPEARAEIQRYPEKAVSIITWMEVMVGADRDIEAATRSFLSGFDVIAVGADENKRPEGEDERRARADCQISPRIDGGMRGMGDRRLPNSTDSPHRAADCV